MRDGGPLMDIGNPAAESVRATSDPMVCQHSVERCFPTSPLAAPPSVDCARCQSLHAAGAAAAPFAHSIVRVLTDRAGSAPESPAESPRPGQRKGRRPRGEPAGKTDAPRRPRGRPPLCKSGPGPRPAGAAREPAGPQASGAACTAGGAADSAKAALAMEGILPDVLSLRSFRPGRPIGRPTGRRPGAARNATAAAARLAAYGGGGPGPSGRGVGWRLERRLM
jgi:hypothetical protein